jgi:hypothetical protein
VFYNYPHLGKPISVYQQSKDVFCSFLSPLSLATINIYKNVYFIYIYIYIYIYNAFVWLFWRTPLTICF